MDAVGARNVAGDRADAAGVLAQGHIPDIMSPVLYDPVRADGAAQDLGAVTGLAR